MLAVLDNHVRVLQVLSVLTAVAMVASMMKRTSMLFHFLTGPQ